MAVRILDRIGAEHEAILTPAQRKILEGAYESLDDARASRAYARMGADTRAAEMGSRQAASNILNNLAAQLRSVHPGTAHRLEEMARLQIPEINSLRASLIATYNLQEEERKALRAP